MKKGQLFLIFLVWTLNVVGCDRDDHLTAHGSSASSTTAGPPSSSDPPFTGITIAPVALAPLPSTFTFSGKVTYGEDRYSKISSPLPGRVVKIQAKLGDSVESGKILLVIDSPDIAAAYSEYIKEHSDLSYAWRNYQLSKEMYEIKALPRKDLKRAENEVIKARAEFRRARERLLALNVPAQELDKPISQQTITSHYHLRSPLAGTVVERFVTPGQTVSGDSTQILFVVANLDKVQVSADVYERDLSLLRPGQEAIVTVEAYPGMTFPAVIERIGDVVDPVSRTIKLRAWVDNVDHKLKPEMFARLNVKFTGGLPFLLVPKKAVVEFDDRNYVYVVEGKERPVKREVKVGYSFGEQVAILEGLSPGERIVINGVVLLKGEDMKREETGLFPNPTRPATRRKP